MFRAFWTNRRVVAEIEGGSLVDSPVFNDTTGTRVSAIQWGSRIFVALVVLFGATVALILSSHVSVPGLERLAPGPDAEEVRPLVRTVPSILPAERAAGRTGSSALQPRLTSQPTTTRVGGPTVHPVKSADARRAVGPTTARPKARPSSAPSVRPTVSPRPTAAAVGRRTEKARNPKAATPSPRGQDRTAKPRTDHPLG